MKTNLGWFKWQGFFAGILACLLLGILIYRKFEFTQQPRPDDDAIVRINELQKELIGTRLKVEALEKRLNETEAKLGTLSSRRAKASGKP
jgi:hypothetical protein